MKTTKILASVALAGILSTSLYAAKGSCSENGFHNKKGAEKSHRFQRNADNGVLGLIKRLDLTKEQKKKVLYFAIAAGSFFAIGILYNLGFESNYKSSVINSEFVSQRMLPQMPENYHEQFKTEYSEFVWSEMMSDWMTNGVLMLIAAGLIYLFAIRKIKSPIMIGGLIVILVFDLWRVDSRPMDVQETSMTDQVFRQKDWVNFFDLIL